MKKWMYILLPLMVLASCHSKPKVVVLNPSPEVEDNRKSVSSLPPGQNNIPTGKSGPQECDTFKVKGGQDQIIAFQLRQDVIDKVTDNKERLKLVRQGNDFQFYFLSLTKEFSGTGISVNNTYACYINIFDEYFATSNDRLGLLLLKADGTKKIIPGVHTFDEWKDEVRKFFKK